MNIILDQVIAGLPWIVVFLALAVVGVAFVSLRARLTAVEQQLDELRNRVGRLQNAPAVPGSHVVPVPQGPRDRSSREARPATSSVAPAKIPTLIAVPDLFAEEELALERGRNQSSQSADREIRDFEERFGQILELDGSGLPPAEISRISGLPVGQVELIVGLSRRLRRSEDQTTSFRS